MQTKPCKKLFYLFINRVLFNIVLYRIAKQDFEEKRTLLTDKHFNINLKNKIYKNIRFKCSII